MKGTLLISSPGPGADALAEMLASEGTGKITPAYSAYGARQETAGGSEFDLICINAPLPDENGMELSRELAKTTRSVVLVIVPKPKADEISELLNPHGVLVIPKPVNRRVFHHYIQFTDCFRRRLLGIERENERLKSMVEDIRLIDRAKLLLVTCLGMTEESAHRYLEKQAMDLRLNKVEIAKQVISTYEN